MRIGYISLIEILLISAWVMVACSSGHKSFWFLSLSLVMGIYFFFTLNSLIFSTIISATFPLPTVFRYSPCWLKSFLWRLKSTIVTLSYALKILCSFLLNTCVSLLMHNVSCSSCLWGAASAKLFILLLWLMKFCECLRPQDVSFILTSFEPPHMTTASSEVRLDISSCASVLICARSAPGITVKLCFEGNSDWYPLWIYWEEWSSILRRFNLF